MGMARGLVRLPLATVVRSRMGVEVNFVSEQGQAEARTIWREIGGAFPLNATNCIEANSQREVEVIRYPGKGVHANREDLSQLTDTGFNEDNGQSNFR